MSSAVARVFATAELLETILTEVADLELSPAATEHDGFLIKAPFVKSVIGLQCVSHHFNNTIRGSSKLLKRRLEAAKIPGMLLTRIDFQLFGPMVWLTLQHHLQLSLIGVAYTDAQVATVTFRMNMDSSAEEWLSRRLEQSWRGIPCLTDPSRVSALQLKVLVSGFVSKMVGPFDMETSATLGDLVQMLLKIFTAEKPRLSRDAHQAQIFETLYLGGLKDEGDNCAWRAPEHTCLASEMSIGRKHSSVVAMARPKSIDSPSLLKDRVGQLSNESQVQALQYPFCCARCLAVRLYCDEMRSAKILMEFLAN